MARYGLGNFLYDQDVENGGANFKFFDPDDASNTAEVSVSKDEFPEGIVNADSREVADLAFAKCSKLLNEKRDERLRVQSANDLSRKHDQDARERDAAADFHNNSQELQNRPLNQKPASRQDQGHGKRDK